MKKALLAVCLSALLLIGSAWAEAAKPLTVVLATDMHYFSPSLTDYSERFMDAVYASDGKAIHYSPQICKAFVRDMLALRPDTVILSGDLTLNGAPVSLREFADLLAPLAEAGIQVLTIPGNHDIGGQAYRISADGVSVIPAASAGEFLEIYGGYGYTGALSRDDASMSYIAKLSDSVWAVMLDVNTGRTPGQVLAATLVWLEEQLQAAQAAGVTVIGVSHQNLMVHNKYFSQGVMITNAPKLQALYRQYGVRLNLSGHTHMQHIAALGNDVVEIVTSSMAVAPGYYGVITLEGKELQTYQAVPVDVEGWAAATGETDGNLLHFSEYMKEFYCEVVRRKVVNTVSAPSIPDADRQRMIDFAVDLSYCDFSGTLADLKNPQALDLWQQYLPNAIFTYYLKGAMANGLVNMNSYDFRK